MDGFHSISAQSIGGRRETGRQSMDQTEVKEQSNHDLPDATPGSSVRPVADGPTAGADRAQVLQEPCPTCGTPGGVTVPPSYVYALGGIHPRFPRLSVEKEFAQAGGRAETANLTDRQTLRKVLEENRYLVRQLCWVMTIGGLETYILVPR